MSIEKNIQTERDFFAAMSSQDHQHLLALLAEDIEWIIPGQGWAGRQAARACRRGRGASASAARNRDDLSDAARIRRAG